MKENTPTIVKVQKFSKAVRIIARITWVACLVGLILCGVCIVWLAVTGDLTASYSVGRMTVLASVSGAGLGTVAGQAGLLAYTAALLGFSLGLVGLCVRLFGNMESQPTPFTAENADLLRKLGVRVILTAILPVIIGQSVGAGAAALLAVEFHGDYGSGFGLLAALLLFALSVVFRYGCELQTQVDETL